MAYLARFNQSHHSICERHENSPAEESDFQDRGFVGHPINVARWIFTCLLSSRHRSQWGSQDALLLSLPHGTYEFRSVVAGVAVTWPGPDTRQRELAQNDFSGMSIASGGHALAAQFKQWRFCTHSPLGSALGRNLQCLRARQRASIGKPEPAVEGQLLSC